MKPVTSMSAPVAEFHEMCDQLLDTAKDLLIANGEHRPTGFVFHGAQMSIFSFACDTFEEKRKTQRDFRKTIRKIKGYQVFLVTENWTKKQKWFDHVPEGTLEGDPLAGECLTVTGVTPEEYVHIQVEFYRGSNGQFVFDEPERCTTCVYDHWVDGVELSVPAYREYKRIVQWAKNTHIIKTQN